MWIRIDDRPPAKDDADPTGCVLVWHKLNGVMIRGWNNISDSRYFTHWMRMPAAPDEVTE